MFNNTKYTKIYCQITNRAKLRALNEYKERHHIIPKSLGGNNDRDNLVYLTGREHFICHWLLIKMTDGKNKSKMVYALNGMKRKNKYQERYETKITSRVYARIRQIIAEQQSETMTGKNKGRPAWNKGKASPLKGTKTGRIAWNKGTTGLCVAWNKGIPRTEKDKAAIRKGKQNIAPEVGLKISKAKIGVPWSEERKSAPKTKCPYCSKEGDPLHMARYHFDKCKQNPSSIDESVVSCPHCSKRGNLGAMHRWHFDNCKFKK